MPIPGHRWAASSIRPIERQIERIDALPLAASAKVLLRLTAGILPALAGSFAGGPLAPPGVLAALVCLYAAAAPMQPGLFEFSARQKYWHINLPVQLFFLSWALALALAGRPSQIGRSVGAAVLLTATAVWPLYMGAKAYARKRRKVPFKTAYGLAAGLVAVQQALIISGGVSW